MIEITVNGENRQVPEGQTLLTLLGHFDLDPARVAIELDRRIVRKTAWTDTVVRPGATLEIVQFVGGG